MDAAALELSRIEVVDDAMVDILRRKTAAERLAMAFDCNRTARLRIEGFLRGRFADWDDARIAGEIARRMSRDSG